MLVCSTSEIEQELEASIHPLNVVHVRSSRAILVTSRRLHPTPSWWLGNWSPEPRYVNRKRLSHTRHRLRHKQTHRWAHWHTGTAGSSFARHGLCCSRSTRPFYHTAQLFKAPSHSRHSAFSSGRNANNETTRAIATCTRGLRRVRKRQSHTFVTDIPCLS